MEICSSLRSLPLCERKQTQIKCIFIQILGKANLDIVIEFMTLVALIWEGIALQRAQGDSLE